MENTGTVDVNIEQGIATVTFGHPRGNSLPGALLRRLAQTIDEVGKNPAARVVVLQSLGDKAFCGGASFDEFQAAKNLEQSKHFFSGFALVIMAMRRCPKFIIARVQGKVVGGGAGIVAASDYAFAVEGAAVRLSELALGIGPFVIGPAVQRKVGVAAFSELAIGADWRDANWARDRGLFAEVYPDVATMDQAIQTFAVRLAESNPEAMRRLKAVLWEGTENWDQLLETRYGHTAELALTDFVQQKIAAVNNR